MNNNDFVRLNGLLSKLSVAADKAAREDGSFRKYHTQSIDALRAMQSHLKHLENGLRTAKIVLPSSAILDDSFEGVRQVR